MTLQNLCIAAMMLLLLPMWIGNIWTCILPVENYLKKILLSWVSGFLTMMAVSQIVLVPLVLRRKSFNLYLKLWIAITIVLLVVATAFIIKKKRQKIKCEQKEKWNMYQSLYLAAALFLIFVQAFIAAAFQHTDDDDSRFVVEQVIAVEQGSMYMQDLVTGANVYWNMGEMKKDLISPWTMMVALLSKLSGIAPASMSHIYLPLFLIPMCYAVYTLLAMHIFKNDKERVCIFLIFVSALNIFGYSSTHTTSAVMLLRIWQGKAMVGAWLLPVILYLMFEIMSNSSQKQWYFLATTSVFATSLASGTGLVSVPILIGICGIVGMIYTRKVATGVKIWCTAIPAVIYLLCYLFVWQLLKIYF